MKQKNHTLSVTTRGQGFVDITKDVRRFVSDAGIAAGLLTLFIQHTSASLVIQENADPDVLTDLKDAFDALAPRNAGYRHTTEGLDDMPAHIRAALTQTSLSIPVQNAVPALGIWQAIYVFEHRDVPHRREVLLHIIGE
jgi:secondary thiamine-phosphate synthase enzyme